MHEDKLRNVRWHLLRHIPSDEIANPVLLPTAASTAHHRSPQWPAAQHNVGPRQSPRGERIIALLVPGGSHVHSA